jgi:nitrous oxidase accessory protein
MKRRPLVCASLFAVATAIASAAAAGPGARTVAEAVGAAEPGDTVLIAPGIYHEHGIVVDRPLTLLGRGRVMIDAGHGGEILTVTADSVTVSGFELRRVGTSFMEDRAALRLAAVRDCVIENNTLFDAFFGVYAENSERCVIRNNVIRGLAERESTSGNGIHLWYCRAITIAGNTIEGHRDGIYFEFVQKSHVASNTSTGNLRYGLHFMFSHQDTYEDNAFIDNGAGVAVMYSNHVRMSRNRFEHNWGEASYGLLLKEISDSDIISNQFHRNTTALYSEGSNRLRISGNEFSNNGFAVKVMANSMGNSFSHNNFMGNAFDVTTNSRQNFNSFDGNYWSAYRGYDLDRDGVGDVPHHPVRLFALLVEKQPSGIILMHSLFVRMIDAAERVMPVFTPETLVDEKPLLEPWGRKPSTARASTGSRQERG